MSKQTDTSESMAARAVSRRTLLKIGSGAFAGAALLGATGRSRGAEGRTLTIGNIGWDEDVALAHLTKVLLERHLDYQGVKIEKKSVDGLFKGVANGEIDTFQDVWLPKTHQSYWKKYSDKLVRLDSWYRGTASLGLTVPDFVEAQSIDDLKKYPSRFNSKIVGIEPGAGEMKIVKNKVMPGYNLSSYQLTSSSTPDMIKKLEQALHKQAPIVVTLYKPHWAFTVYRLRYLDDPKGLISDSNEELYSVVRKGLKKDHPGAYALLNAISLTPDQLGKLELAINLADTPTEGVKTWLSGDRPFGSQNGLNNGIVQPWINMARQAEQNA